VTQEEKKLRRLAAALYFRSLTRQKFVAECEKLCSELEIDVGLGKFSGLDKDGIPAYEKKED